MILALLANVWYNCFIKRGEIMTNLFLQLGLTIAVAYIIGSIPTGYLIVKSKTGDDIRTIGSGSTGATNVKRVLGKKWFFIVLLLDAFKGALPVILATLFITAQTGNNPNVHQRTDLINEL